MYMNTYVYIHTYCMISTLYHTLLGEGAVQEAPTGQGRLHQARGGRNNNNSTHDSHTNDNNDNNHTNDTNNHTSNSNDNNNDKLDTST